VLGGGFVRLTCKMRLPPVLFGTANAMFSQPGLKLSAVSSRVYRWCSRGGPVYGCNWRLHRRRFDLCNLHKDIDRLLALTITIASEDWHPEIKKEVDNAKVIYRPNSDPVRGCNAVARGGVG